MKRNRIVINFEPRVPGGSGGRSSRRGRGIVKVLAVIAIILVLIVGGIAGGAFFWWRHYQSSPAYSLALLVDAIQRNDKQKVDELLDTDKIAADFVSQIRARVPSALAVGQVDAAKIISPKLRDTLHDQLIKQVQQLTDAAAGKPFVLVALAVPHFADIKQDDNSAHASINLKDEQIELAMVPVGDKWKVTTVR